MRATEHQGVDPRLAHRRQQALGEHVHLVGVDVAGLDELDEAGAGGARELDVGASMRSAARWYAPGRDRADRADHADATGPGRSHGSPHPRLDHADHRDVGSRSSSASSAAAAALLHATTRGASPRVDEEVGDLERVLHDLVARLRTVREPAGVAEVHDRLVGQQVDERPQHGEPAEARVEHADGPVGSARAALTAVHGRGRRAGRRPRRRCPPAVGGTASSTSSPRRRRRAAARTRSRA